ncbi:MAG: hypothetical protein ACK5KS_10960 [Planctomyces sp.]
MADRARAGATDAHPSVVTSMNSSSLVGRLLPGSPRAAAETGRGLRRNWRHQAVVGLRYGSVRCGSIFERFFGRSEGG